MTTAIDSILPASSMDRRLLRAAAKYATPQELSEAVLGKLSPAQAQERVLQILDSKTALDEVQERRLLLVQMAEHLDWMREQRHNPKAWTSISQMFKIVSDQIERANVNLTDVSSKLGADHAQYFIDGYMVGFERMLRVLKDEHSLDVPEEIVLEVMESGIMESKDYVDRVTLKEIE